MAELIRLVSAIMFGAIVVAAFFGGVAANAGAPEALGRCSEFLRLWTRYETAHCPNQSGQRAQAEWAFYRCQQGDFDSGLRELQRLLRRDLIVVPPATSSSSPASAPPGDDLPDSSKAVIAAISARGRRRTIRNGVDGAPSRTGKILLVARRVKCKATSCGTIIRHDGGELRRLI